MRIYLATWLLEEAQGGTSDQKKGLKRDWFLFGTPEKRKINYVFI